MDFLRVGWSLAFLYLQLFLYAQSAFVVEQNSISVTSPEEIKGKYDGALANFGMPSYGATLSGTLVYPNKNKLACSNFDTSHSYHQRAGVLPNILLIDRGDCYFAEKVWNSQRAGASAVLIADDREEELLTMDSPDDPLSDNYINNISIPSALISKSTADKIKGALSKKEMVNLNIDWRESLPHPDERVEYEFWTNSNDECGAKCDIQAEFLKQFKGIAQTMEQNAYTSFTPHYITWYCPPAYLDTPQCKSQCINNGRYCAPDPEQDFEIGYEGKDVVKQNLREICIYQQAKQMNKPWAWWDYVTDFKLRCHMSDNTYDADCAERVATTLGFDIRKLKDCFGDPEADVPNPALKDEQDAQVGSNGRSDVTILPTLIINQRQYRGKLEAKSVLKAICSGFREGTDPPQCLGNDIQTNECSNNNGGCWHEDNHTACKDTYRGRICECPEDPISGLKFVGDGYTNCKVAGPGRCLVHNGGCWEKTVQGIHFTACQDSLSGNGCQCPYGFNGDGTTCEDVDECSDKDYQVCKCEGCKCRNTFGSYECSCKSGVYLRDQDICLASEPSASTSRAGWWIALVVLAFVAVASVGGYVLYKYRLRSYMDSEIRAIMAQYMPLDSQNELNPRQNAEP